MITKVFKNLDAQGIRDSVEVFEKAIKESQIIMFPGGFSAGDEPDGSAKFFATEFRNEKLKEAVMDLLNNRDGLALGICNGFQALIKLGLVPEGKIVEQNAKSPTLTTNRIGRHISKVAYTRIASNLSPWFNNVHVDDIFSIPVSHGEGRFVADEDVIQKLFENGQVATQYVDLNGDPTMNEEFNPERSEDLRIRSRIFQIRVQKKNLARKSKVLFLLLFWNDMNCFHTVFVNGNNFKKKMFIFCSFAL